MLHQPYCTHITLNRPVYAVRSKYDKLVWKAEIAATSSSSKSANVIELSGKQFMWFVLQACSENSKLKKMSVFDSERMLTIPSKDCINWDLTATHYFPNMSYSYILRLMKIKTDPIRFAVS